MSKASSTAPDSASPLWKGETWYGIFAKLGPLYQLRNPVMFVVYLGAILTSALWIRDIVTHLEPFQLWHFTATISLWLWLTVLFSNGAETIAEGRGKAQADHLRSARKDIRAKKIQHIDQKDKYTLTHGNDLRIGDLIIIEEGDFVAGDGQVIAGIASIDESAITGESAPVIRESGGDRDSVTAGTRVLSDWVVVRITANPGEMFIDKMINLVEGAKRHKTPNEMALSVLLSALTLIFLTVSVSLYVFSSFSVSQMGQGDVISITVLTALLVCLAPTTIGGLLSAIGIAGMNRLMQANVIARSGRAVEAAGDINILLLDKTGTITIGNREAVAFFPADNVSMHELASAAALASLADETPEGKSIVQLARSQYKIAPVDFQQLDATFIPFTAEKRISGIKFNGEQILKGAGDAIEQHLQLLGSSMPTSLRHHIDSIARSGGTPLVVAHGSLALGVVQLKDIVKSGIKERLESLRRMGIKSVMITGDNPLTAAAIANEAGVDDFLAEARPEDKLRMIRDKQQQGELVAMVGDGTNDAPALAQADVAVVMNSGTQAAKEAGNMVDLDSDPTKLIEVVEIGKQLLMTRGALTTFSIANDVAKYFAIIPAALATTYPSLHVLNILQLSSPEHAIISAVIFNALMIVALIPLALRGVAYRPLSAQALLTKHALWYGVGGFITPFIGIKFIDILLNIIF
jgi:K+-transporting ATPase ATPase B chain